MTKANEEIRTIESNGGLDTNYIEMIAKSEGCNYSLTYLQKYIKEYLGVHGNTAWKIALYYF